MPSPLSFTVAYVSSYVHGGLGSKQSSVFVMSKSRNPSLHREQGEMHCEERVQIRHREERVQIVKRQELKIILLCAERLAKLLCTSTIAVIHLRSRDVVHFVKKKGPTFRQ